MSGRSSASSAPKVIIPIASLFQYSKEGAAELIDRIHGLLSTTHGLKVTYLADHNWFNVQCRQQDRPLVERTTCTVMDSYEKEVSEIAFASKPPKIKRLGRMIEDDVSIALSHQHPTQSIAHHDLDPGSRPDNVFTDSVCKELFTLTGIKVDIDYANHRLVLYTDRANELRVRIQCIEQAHAIESKPISTFHVETAKGTDAHVQACILFDQQDHLLRRTLVHHEQDLVNVLPRCYSWLLARHGPVSGAMSTAPSESHFTVQTTSSLNDVQHQQSRLKSLSHQVSQCLDNAKYYRGSISVHVDIGRALFLYSNLGVRMRDVVASRKVQKLLNDGDIDGPIEFTRMVTSSFDDTNRIIMLLKTKHQGMFVSEPYITRSFFELQFDHHADIVEIDSATKLQISTTRLGHTTMLYPKHVWDARFEVVGRKVHQQIEAEFAPTIASLRLKPGAGAGALHLTWDQNGRGPAVSRVLFKNGLRFRTAYTGWILQVTEVQDRILQDLGDSCSTQSGSREEMIEQGRLWYELRLLPSEELAAFEQNKTLELGRMAQYSEMEMMTEEQLATMREFTNDLIARLNGVGLANQGPRGDDEDVAQILAMKREREKVKEMQRMGE